MGRPGKALCPGRNLRDISAGHRGQRIPFSESGGTGFLADVYKRRECRPHVHSPATLAWTLPIDATCASWLGCKGNATIRFCMRKEQFARSESRLERELERARAIPLFSDTLLPTRFPHLWCAGTEPMPLKVI